MTRKKKEVGVFLGRANPNYPWTKKEQKKIEIYHGYTWLFCDQHAKLDEIKGYFENCDFEWFARPEYIVIDLQLAFEGREENPYTNASDYSIFPAKAEALYEWKKMMENQSM